jgi:hypothetical protein
MIINEQKKIFFKRMQNICKIFAICLLLIRIIACENNNMKMRAYEELSEIFNVNQSSSETESDTMTFEKALKKSRT